jgi:hypothetical protein
MRHDNHRTTPRIFFTLLAPCAAAGTLVPAAPTVADHSYRVLALTGDDAPGTNSTFFSLSGPRINLGGQVSFFAELDNGGWGLYRSVYDDPATLELIVLTGDSVPGGPLNSTFLGDVENSVVINNDGTLGFAMTVDGLNEEYNDGIFRFRDDALETVALSGDQVPGIAGVEFNRMGTPSMNASDSMAFHAFLQGAGVNNTNDQGLFAHGFGGLNTIVREGWGAPGRPNDHFGSLGGMSIADDGRLAFYSALNDDNDQGSVWTGWPGLLEPAMVAGEGNPNVGGFLNYSLSGVGLSIMSVAPSGFHRDLGQGIQSVAVVGQPGPLGTYEYVDEFQGDSNAEGAILFAARFAGPADDLDTAIIHIAANGQETVVVRENDPALGYWNGVEIADLTTQYPTRIVADDAGRIFYRVPLRGSAITPGNDAVLYADDLNGTTEALVRKGGVLDVGGGDFRLVEDFSFYTGGGTQSGRRGAVTESGDVALVVQFTDGSEAVVVAQLDLFCAGDFNDDGYINVQDFLILLANWGATTPIGENGDTDRNGVVDTLDFLELLATWGPCA